MPRTSDKDLKMIFEEIGTLFDARAKTLEININAHTDASIRASEERVKAELRAELASKEDIKDMATKSDLKKLEERMAGKKDIKDMSTKSDIARLEKKFDETKDLRRQVEELKRRLDNVEAECRE